MINDHVDAVLMLNVVYSVCGNQPVDLLIPHPSLVFLLVDLDVVLYGQEWVIGFLTQFKAYSGHLGLL